MQKFETPLEVNKGKDLMKLDSTVSREILAVTGAKKITGCSLIQKLWSDYGELLRVDLVGANYPSVIVKHIKFPVMNKHAKGFNSDFARNRKVRSYQVEKQWYEQFNIRNLVDLHSLTAGHIGSFEMKDQSILILEDLNAHGLTERPTHMGIENMKVVLSWLASFHAKFLYTEVQGLWNRGGYWHLDTRPDELVAMAEGPLKWSASLIDQRLRSAQFNTIIHGDAKLANFCFSPDHTKVGAVDFQYVGAGVGTQDLAYFVGSCLEEDACEIHEREILDFYFDCLKQNLVNQEIDLVALEKEWRELYPVAWIDFQRFLKGWSPGHWKINSYSEKLEKAVLSEIHEELFSAAKNAALAAGELAMRYWQKEFKVLAQKPGRSEASQALTEVDIKCQKLILNLLTPVIEKYDLAILAEEENADCGRFDKEYFLAIDPIDGTLPFSKGEKGFAISIALVKQDGVPLIGLAYDPVDENLFHAIRGQGCFQNGRSISIKNKKESNKRPLLFVDHSLTQHSSFDSLEEKFEVIYAGGAVMNTIGVLLNENAAYFKYPKPMRGGGAIWDFAAVKLILEEAGGSMTDFSGNELHFNRKKTKYFNDVGILAASDKSLYNFIKDNISLNE